MGIDEEQMLDMVEFSSDEDDDANEDVTRENTQAFWIFSNIKN